MDLPQAIHLHRQGRRDLAEPACRQVLARQPSDAFAWHLLGMILTEEGRGAEALDCLVHSIRLKPNEAQFHSNLSAVLGMMGRYDESLDAAHEAWA